MRVTDRSSSIFDGLQPSISIADSFGDVIDPVEVLPAVGFLLGSLPYKRSFPVLSHLDIDALATQLDAVIQRRSHHDGVAAQSAALEAEGLWVYVETRSSRSNVIIYADSTERLNEACDLVKVGFAPAPTVPGAPPVQFMYRSNQSITRNTRPVIAPTWDEIANNYSGSVSRALERLTQLTQSAVESTSARLLLIHGAPGTGKTTAVRSLIRSWPWADAVVVLDPVNLLTDPTYLNEAVLEEDTDDDDGVPPRWRLIIIEDADELIRNDAKDRTGQALSHLLNVTDGIVGQGLHAMFLITTNEPLSALHPAVTRHGRCLANVSVGPLSPTEATVWMLSRGRAAQFSDPKPLAELYEILDETAPRIGSPASAPVVGQYL